MQSIRTNGSSADNKNVKPQDAYVLVVEDNVPNFVLIARMLAFMGIQNCEWKTTGWGVVDFAQTMPRVDLVLMDLRLPHEDGYKRFKDKGVLFIMSFKVGLGTGIDKLRALKGLCQTFYLLKEKCTPRIPCYL